MEGSFILLFQSLAHFNDCYIRDNITKGLNNFLMHCTISHKRCSSCGMKEMSWLKRRCFFKKITLDYNCTSILSYPWSYIIFFWGGRIFRFLRTPSKVLVARFTFLCRYALNPTSSSPMDIKSSGAMISNASIF